jgi:hypothetical protein
VYFFTTICTCLCACIYIWASTLQIQHPWPMGLIRSLAQTVINELQHTVPLGTVTCIARRKKIEGTVTICQQLLSFTPYKLKLPLDLGKWLVISLWFYEPGLNIKELVWLKGITMEEIPSKLKQGWYKLMCVKQSLKSLMWQIESHFPSWQESETCSQLYHF